MWREQFRKLQEELATVLEKLVLNPDDQTARKEEERLNQAIGQLLDERSGQFAGM